MLPLGHIGEILKHDALGWIHFQDTGIPSINDQGVYVKELARESSDILMQFPFRMIVL